MPTIEFHGFTSDQAHGVRNSIREELRGLEYAAELVFEVPTAGATDVRDIDGKRRPFVRVCSRSAERSTELARRIARFSDVETALLTTFTARQDSDQRSSPSDLREDGIVAGIAPIRYFGLSLVLSQILGTPLDDYIGGHRSVQACGAASECKLAVEHVQALLTFLANEGLLLRQGSAFVETARYQEIRRCKGWYRMLVNGYTLSLQSIATWLGDGRAVAPREAGLVGEGSCEISRYDAIPLARNLMAKSGRSYHRVLDLGCGDAAYLVEFCAAFPEICGVGVERSDDGYIAARERIRAHGLEERIRLVRGGALEYLEHLRVQPCGERPDLSVLGFVLHELLGQEGRQGVVAFLRELTAAAPEIDLVVIEVDDQSTDQVAMAQPLAQAYYNLYYLLHALTAQKLIAPEGWEAIFAEAGLTVVAREYAPENVDSTRFEIGYLLRRRSA